MRDLFFQSLAVLLEFRVAPLDLFQHPVKRARQPSKFVVVANFGSNRIVTSARNRFGGFNQLQDRSRNRFLKVRCQHESQREGDQQSDYESEGVSSQSRIQFFQIGFEVQGADSFPRQHDLSELNQVTILELGDLRMRGRRYEA